MSANSIPTPVSLSGALRPGLMTGIARRAVLGRLARLRHGRLTVVEGHEQMPFGDPSGACSLSATVRVHDARFYGEVAFGGTVGAGEAYMLGYWSCDDLTAAVRILLLNRALLDGMERGLARLSAAARKLFHRLHRNTARGSRVNIAAHYDLGNELFALFLDPTLMYSCAVFEHPQATLEEASAAKLERVCRKLQLAPTDRVMEIGTGWGGFALHAARRYGCHVTTTTISREQHGLAVQRVRAAGLTERVTVLRQDYRELRGQYDKLVSIEMIEAVGHAYYDTFFGRCSALLKPDGMMLLQAITIADQRYEQARRSVDFIQRYIFPGSCIPSLSALSASLARASDLRLFHLEDIGPHYATTLRAWRRRFFERIEEVRALGYPESFIRMWDFYLCYCEGGFLERAIGDVQMLLTKPGCRRASLIPPLLRAAGEGAVPGSPAPARPPGEMMSEG